MSHGTDVEWFTHNSHYIKILATHKSYGLCLSVLYLFHGGRDSVVRIVTR